MGGLVMYQQMREMFSNKFKLWGIEIEESELFMGNKKYMLKNNWHLRWMMGKDATGTYLEYYAINDKYGHLHGRIYENGREEQLNVLQQYIAYAPSIVGDRERCIREFEIYNKGLMSDLKKKGLL